MNDGKSVQKETCTFCSGEVHSYFLPFFFLNNNQIVFTFISLLPEAEPYRNSSECISYVALPALTQH